VGGPGNLDDVTSLTTYATSVDSAFVTALVVLLVYAETATLLGMVVPSEAVLLVAGGLVASGTLSADWLVPLTVVAAVAGDCTAWLVGRRLGPQVRRGRIGQLLGERRWARAEAVLDQRGPVTVVAARWVGFVRTLVPLLAGAGRMPFRRFLLADAVACLFWASGILTMGYLGAAALLTSAWAWPLAAALVVAACVAHRRPLGGPAA
jgi:membrane protein DedA with SNARE-associated domain